ncbi:MAG TPA: YfhO family protein [Chitinophagaceae bacterium]|nr:YfhO family protein [Chitinophagaceae bacterium]
MKNINWKKILPHVYAIAIFLIVAIIYCKPALEDKVLHQADVTQWKSMAQNQQAVLDATDKVPLWSNGMFGGMPGYMIKGWSNNMVGYYFMDLISLNIPKPFLFFFLASICFYFLTQVLRANTWVGTIISLCYAYATYNVVIVAEGHDTKMLSLAVLPGLIGAIQLIFNKKYLWGITLTALFSSVLVAQKHYQIAYYGILIVAFMSIAFVVQCILKKELKHLLFAGLFAIAGVALGALQNAVILLPDNEYTKESIRGGSQLANDHTKTTKEGLTKEYAFSYSMYKTEPFVMLIPRMFGGSNKMELEPEKSKAVANLQAMNPQIAQQLQSALSFYWGGIGGTSGPPYVGAIICFLALIGFVILNNKHKWWILALTVLTIMMSWGSFFEGFNNFLFNHLPLYNKFRAPSMILVVPTILLNIMAVLTLQKIIETKDKAALFIQYKKGLMITGGVFIILILMYFGFDYKGESDTNLITNINNIPDAETKAVYLDAGKKMLNGLVEDRKSLFMSDILRALFYVAVAALAIWLLIKNKAKEWMLLASIGLFSFIDIMTVDVKYLNSDNYQYKEDYETSFNPTPADKFILQDKSDYRVFDVSNGAQAAINYGARASYYHQSVGGYHPAKLSIFQDLAENQLYNYPNCKPVLNMLNTKYIIHGTSKADQVEINRDACGPVWFIKALKIVGTPNEEMNALTNLSVKDTAVIGKGFEQIANTKFSYDTTANITVEMKQNDVITYKSKANTEQFAVFSEIYYNKGWNAYIDGKLTPYAKVNYVLRGMPIPAGEHEIMFKFEPKSHALGWKFSGIAEMLIYALLALTLFSEWKNRNKKA